MTLDESRDVVITGIGVVSPSGNTVDEFQRNLWNGVISIDRIELKVDNGEIRALPLGRVHDFDPTRWLDARVLDGTDVGHQFALAAADMARVDAGIDSFDERRTAIVSGSSIGGVGSLLRAQHVLETEGVDAVPAKTMIRIFSNIAASQMAMRWNLHGPQITLVHACATGVDVVGTAAQLVRSGAVDVAIAGGYESSAWSDEDDGFVPCLVAAQAAYGMVPDVGACPSRPFDKHRSGVVSGEGAAYVVIEAAEHAASRGVRPWARVLGYGSLADAYHPSSPEPSGRWEREVMQSAIDSAAITVDDIDAVIAHGTSTIKGDESEINALNDLFKDRAVPIPVTSIKGHMGHPGAASGCLAIVAAALAMRVGSLVHTAGTQDVDDAVRFDVITGTPRPLQLDTILVNAFGFGGQNAALVVGSP